MIQAPLVMLRTGKTYFSSLYITSISFEELFETQFDFLNADECTYFKSLQHQNRQYSYLLGRYCAKKALSAAPFNIPPTLCSIERGIFGQPIVKSPSYNVQVCIAHSANIGAAIAYPEEHPMGIDLELIDDEYADTMRGEMTDEEFELAFHCTQNKTKAGALLWTAKEALSKILKTGRMMPFQLLEISSIRIENDFFYSQFKNFFQYQACSFILDGHFISIVYPGQTTIKFPL